MAVISGVEEVAVIEAAAVRTLAAADSILQPRMSAAVGISSAPGTSPRLASDLISRDDMVSDISG